MFTNTEASIPELKERIARTIDFIKGLKPAPSGTYRVRRAVFNPTYTYDLVPPEMWLEL